MGILWMAIGIFLFSWVSNYAVKKIAPKLGAVDKPNERRINKIDIPNLGGFSIFLSFLIISLFIHESYLNKVLLGAAIIVMVGVLDDIYEISPILKLIGQISTASVAYFSGMKFGFHPIYSYIFIVFWLVLVMNAFNFLDGMDGLVAGSSGIIFLCFGLTNPHFVNISLLMTASIMGFLLHNFSPKNKMYLGDTGSMLLGYLIGCFLGINYFSESLYLYPVPFIYIGLVLYDIVYVVADRKMRRKKIWKAERNHIHHRLIEKIKNQKIALIIIYLITLLFCGIAYLLQYKINMYR